MKSISKTIKRGIYLLLMLFIFSAIKPVLVLAERLSVKDFGSLEFIEQDTSQALKYFQRGKVKYDAKDYSGALQDFEIAINHDPTNWKVYRYKANTLLILEKFNEAVVDYSKAISINKSDTLSYKGRANARRFNDDFFGALKDYDVVIEMDPIDHEMLYGRAYCNFNLKRIKEAIYDLSICVKLKPTNANDYQARGTIYFLDFQYKNAIVDFNNYFRFGGDNIENYYLRGFSYFQLNSENILYADSAISDMKNYEMSNEKKNRQPFRILAGAYAVKDDSANARKYFQKSVDLEPKNLLTYSLWGKAEVNFGNNQKALDLLNKALSLTSDSQTKGELHYARGLAKIGLCDLRGSLEDFKSSLESDSLNTDAHELRLSILLGNSSLRNNDILRQDINYLIRVSRKSERSSSLYSARGLINIFDFNVLGANLDIEKAIELSPSNPFNYLIKGLIKANSNYDVNSVLADYNKGIQLRSTLWQPYILKAYFYRQNKDKKNANYNLEKAVKLGAKIPSQISDYISSGRGSLKNFESAVDFVIYPYLINIVVKPNSKTIKCPAIEVH